MSMVLSELMADLFELAREYVSDKGRASHEGHSFEDQVIEVVKEHKDVYDLKVFDPRTILPFNTYSSLRHQLDGVFKHGTRYYFIECKHRKAVTLDHIGYFNSKLLDYALGAHGSGLREEVKGLFLATSAVGDSTLRYALSYGIIVIDPETPPLSHVIETSQNADLKEALISLYEKLDQPFDYLDPPAVDADRLVKSYRYLVGKWREA